MFVVTPFPNVLYALDLGAPGVPLKWKYKPKPLAAAQGVACCDVVNRGAAYADGLVFFNTLDNRTVAVDAATGSLASGPSSSARPDARAISITAVRP